MKLKKLHITIPDETAKQFQELIQEAFEIRGIRRTQAKADELAERAANKAFREMIASGRITNILFDILGKMN